MKQFKIRCSSIGKIMTHGKVITEKQLQLLNELELKKKLTEKQELTLIELKNKRDFPELSETSKTYCKSWIKSNIYNRKLEFTSKYTDKGIIMEDESIDFVSKILGLGMLFKNEKYYENNYMTGTNDVEIPNLVIDVKNSWSWETFPLLEKDIPNIDYYWQLQGYMDLTCKKKAKLIYILSDTPIHLIEREARNYCFYNGYGDLDIEIYNEFHKKLTYKDIPDKFKIKIWDINYDKNAIDLIKNKVIECRNYINKIVNNIQRI